MKFVASASLVSGRERLRLTNDWLSGRSSCLRAPVGGIVSLIDSVGEKSEATYLATLGLEEEYCLGRPETGRVYYQRSRDAARKSRNAREEAWTMLFQAREDSDSTVRKRTGC